MIRVGALSFSFPAAMFPLVMVLALGGCQHDWDAVTLQAQDSAVGPDGDIDAADAPDDDGTDAAVDAAKPACDPTELPADDMGIFVSPMGTPAGDGTRANPLASIKAGLAAAVAAAKAIIYLDAGTYPESVTIGATAPTGLSLLGGWTAAGPTWSRNCAADRRDQTIVASPGAIGVSVTGVTGNLVLRDFTITTETKGVSLASGDGETVVGLSLRSDTGHIALNNMHIVGGAGGDGAARAQPAVSANAACTGTTDCGTGLAGTTPAAGTASAGATFVAGVFTPGVGAAGGTGTDGGNGKPGAAGQSAACVTSCTGATTVCPAPACTAVSSTLTGGTGTCGCAGLAGAAGLPGRGGGASIGVLAHGAGVIVDARGSLIVGSAGGAGSAGGLGGTGGPGTSAIAGASTSCAPGPCQSQSAAAKCQCVVGGTATTLTGGTAGGKGGKGGNGSAGGGGAGGWSFAIVTSVGAQVNPDSGTVLRHATGGAGRGGAATGQSGDIIGVQ